MTGLSFAKLYPFADLFNNIPLNMDLAHVTPETP